MNKQQLRRLGSALLAASLLTALVATTASAASSTRIVSIGSTTDCAAAVLTNGAPGTLTTSSATVGGLVRVDVSVENCGGQNLSNAVLTIGGPQAGDAQPASAFTDGSVFDSIENTSACKGTGTGLLTCTYKSLRPAVPVSVRTYIKTGSVGTLNIAAVVQFNEGTNSTGSNPQTFVAGASTTVGETTCDSFSTYLSTSRRTAALCDLQAAANTNRQSTSVKLLGDSLAPASVTETVDGPTCTAPSGLTCFGAYSNASVSTASGDIIEWTVVVDLNYTGNTNLNTKKVVVYHWYDDPTFNGGTGFVQLANTSADNCKTRSASTGCIVSVTKSSSSILTVIFRTPANGKTRLLG